MHQFIFIKCLLLWQKKTTMISSRVDLKTSIKCWPNIFSVFSLFGSFTKSSMVRIVILRKGVCLVFIFVRKRTEHSHDYLWWSDVIVSRAFVLMKQDNINMLIWTMFEIFTFFRTEFFIVFYWKCFSWGL